MKNKLPPTIPSFHKRKDILKKEIWYKGKKRKNKSNIWFFVVKFTFILSLLEVFSCYDSSRMCIHFSASAALSVLFFTFQALLITLAGQAGPLLSVIKSLAAPLWLHVPQVPRILIWLIKVVLSTMDPKADDWLSNVLFKITSWLC